MVNLTDEELAVKTQQGDRDAFASLVERYEDSLLGYARRLMSFNQNYEDVVQETFYKAYRDINGYDAKRKFSSWIFRIAHNESVNYFRKNRFAVSLEEIHEISDRNDFADSLHHKLDTQSQRKVLAEGLKQIPRKYREAIILRFYGNKSYEEIADIMHVPKGTVGTYVKRGKQKLKMLIGKDISIEDIL
jgi:RNA polymerase sigma-70 factor (ECF subfamily)